MKEDAPICASLLNFAGPDLPVLLSIIALFGSFLVWMLLDCVRNEPSDGNGKLIWVLIIIFAPLGSFIYLFARKLKRSRSARESS
jgi:hypothetical protein